MGAPAGAAELSRGFGQMHNDLDKQIREALLRSTSKTSAFGASAMPHDRQYYTAESLLLASLPVECPPLDVLKTELEKFYVLREDIDAVDVYGRRAAIEQARPTAKRSTFSDTYWAVLREAQTEAVSAVVASRPLFRLFLASSTAKIGSRRLDQVQEVRLASTLPPVAGCPSACCLLSALIRTVQATNISAPHLP